MVNRFTTTDYDLRLTVDRLGRYYVCVPYHDPNACVLVTEPPSETSLETQGKTKKEEHPDELRKLLRKRNISLDPGVRTFMTGYCPDGHIYEFGRYDIKRIHRLCEHLDDLISRSTRVKAKKRYRMKRAAQRMRYRIRDLVDDMHRKLAHFLCSRFDVVLLPKFEPSKKTKKKEGGNRKIGKRTSRDIYSWSFYRFEQGPGDQHRSDSVRRAIHDDDLVVTAAS